MADIERAKAALLAAHAAGDTDSAQKLADYIRADQAISKESSESSSMMRGRGAGGFTGGVLSALQGPTLGFLDEAAGVGSGVLSTLQGKGSLRAMSLDVTTFVALLSSMKRTNLLAHK